MISRRALLVVAAGIPTLAGADARDVFSDVLSDMTSALAGNETYNIGGGAFDPIAAAGMFMSHLDKSFPNREQLRANLESLLSTAVVTSSIEFVKVQEGEADVDWYMLFRSRSDGTEIERRRKVINIHMNPKKKITSMTPIDFFAPVKIK
jgi:hypothetical protein